VLELRQRLVARGGTEVVRLDLGQGFEVTGADYSMLAPTLGETYGRLGTRIGWFGAQAMLRFDPLLSLGVRPGPTLLDRTLLRDGGPTRLAARAELDDGRHGAWVQYEQLQMEGTTRSRQPLDLLFLIQRGYTSSTMLRQLTFGARWDFGPVSLGYSGLVAEANVQGVTQFVLQQQTAMVGIAPACDCWRVDVSALFPTYPEVRAPSFGFNVTISKFGTIGAR
jgi:hypothetical protein